MTKLEALRAISVVTKGNVYDADYNGGEWMVNAVETQESFADFDEATHGYNECSKPQAGTIGGCPFVVYKNVQFRKGDQRRALAIIDLEECRVAIDAELGDFVN